MSADPLDPPTLIADPPPAGGDEGSAQVPALTIVWHPDATRIGQTAVLADQRAEVSRLQPLFQSIRAAGAKPAGLADRHLSARVPALGIGLKRDGVELSALSDTALMVDGADLIGGTVALSKGDLERGALVVLAHRIVLCAHLIRSPSSSPPRDHGLVGSSDAMDEIRREIDRVADLDVPVLLRGETGTGKGMIAQAIVTASRRAGRTFLSLNMGATVASTAAADLFGHERGAFTGATGANQGLFAAADKGTLFLDEVGLASPDVQKMLLLAVERGEVLPLGGTRARKIDVRLIAATDTDLPAAIAAGTFSRALFERLARYQIMAPALRHRREDIGALLLHFLRRAFRTHGLPDRLDAPGGTADPWLSAPNVAALAAYAWPGNIRELENVAGQIVVFSRDRETAALPPSVRALLAAPPPDRAASPKPRPRRPTDPSHEQVARALARHQSAKRAADSLKVSRTKYYELRRGNPLVGSINTITDAELAECRRKFGGDVLKMADALKVSPKALKDRLARRKQ
jgi:two-component system nitrogen regulation response regulator GlnG